jgi:DNA (cytosine-5)-methyltransferase 1
MGLRRAGFEVVGVDIRPQPHYPFKFVQADALEFEIGGFEFIWASPPCQAHSSVSRSKKKYACHIDATRRKLQKSGKPYVIENVVGAPLVNPIMLCGAMFNLGVIRHRLFETNWGLKQPAHVKHKGSLLTGEYVTVTGNGGVPSWTYKKRERLGLPRFFPGEMSLERWQKAMGIDWLPRKELTQAIPPAYSEYIARQFKGVA